MTNYRLMQVKILQDAPMGAFCNAFDLHQATSLLLRSFLAIFEWSFYTGFTVSSAAAVEN